MGNDYYLKHKSKKRVTLNMNDRLVIQTLLAMEIAFDEHELDKTMKPAFSVEHMKELYEKVSGKRYEDLYERK